jgi:TolB-like protein
MKLKYLIFLAIATSCSTTIKNFDKYEKQFLSKTEFMPSKENLENKPPKIVVLTLDENENSVATQSQLGNSIANNVENILSQNRLVELVDRKAANKLQKEITLLEINKTGSYEGPKIAEFAISGTISNAGFISKYSSGNTFLNPKTGLLSI